MNLADLRSRLVPDWPSAWRWASVRVAALGAVALAWVLTNPGDFLQLILVLPAGLRPVLAFIWFAAWLGSRLWKQKPRKPQ